MLWAAMAWISLLSISFLVGELLIGGSFFISTYTWLDGGGGVCSSTINLVMVLVSILSTESRLSNSVFIYLHLLVLLVFLLFFLHCSFGLYLLCCWCGAFTCLFCFCICLDKLSIIGYFYDFSFSIFGLAWVDHPSQQEFTNQDWDYYELLWATSSYVLTFFAHQPSFPSLCLSLFCFFVSSAACFLWDLVMKAMMAGWLTSLSLGRGGSGESSLFVVWLLSIGFILTSQQGARLPRFWLGKLSQ